MDNQLRKLKNHYKHKYTSSFTTSDRDAIYNKIRNEKMDRTPKFFNHFRTGLTLLAVFIISFLMVMSQINSNEPASDVDKNEELLPLQKVSLTGYVVHKTDSKTFVTNYDTKKALVLTDVPKDVFIGEEIKVWYEPTSNNEQSTFELNHFERSYKTNYSNNQFNEDAIVRNALRESTLKHPSRSAKNLYVSSVSFNQKHGSWTVKLYHSNVDQYEIITISDQTGYLAKPRQVTEIESDYSFNYNRYGKQFKDLEQLLIWELNSKSSNLNNLARQDFKNRTGTFKNVDYRYLLNGASIDSNGSVTIDFKPFKTSFTTAEVGSFVREIKNLVFRFEEAQEVYLQFNGSQEPQDAPFEFNVTSSIKRDEAIMPNDPYFDLFRTTQAYMGTFKYLLQFNENAKLEFDTRDELLTFFTRHMSEDLAEQHMNIFIDERDGDFYASFSHLQLPTLIKGSNFEYEKVDEQTYLVEQALQNEQGNVIVQYTIKEVNHRWFVDSVKTRLLE